MSPLFVQVATELPPICAHLIRPTTPGSHLVNFCETLFGGAVTFGPPEPKLDLPVFPLLPNAETIVALLTFVLCADGRSPNSVISSGPRVRCSCSTISRSSAAIVIMPTMLSAAVWRLRLMIFRLLLYFRTASAVLLPYALSIARPALSRRFSAFCTLPTCAPFAPGTIWAGSETAAASSRASPRKRFDRSAILLTPKQLVSRRSHEVHIPRGNFPGRSKANHSPTKPSTLSDAPAFGGLVPHSKKTFAKLCFASFLEFRVASILSFRLL